MTPVTSYDSISTALEAAKNGDPRGAQAIIAQALQADPADVAAWLCLAAVHPDTEKKRYALERVLALDPEHTLVRQALKVLSDGHPEETEHIVMEFLSGPAEARKSVGISAEGPFNSDEVLADAPAQSPQAAVDDAEADTPEGQPEPGFETDHDKATDTRPPDEAVSAESLEENAPGRVVTESAADRTENGTTEANAEALSEEAAGAPAKAAAGAVSKRPAAPRRKNSCAQTLVLVVLALLAVGSVAALGYLLWQEGLLPFGNNPGAGGGAIPTSAGMPRTPIPTWTATASPVPSPTSIQLPNTPTPIPPTPAPSITPLQPGRLIVIGRSVDKRPIEVVRFGSGPNARLVVAGVHAGEGLPGITLADHLIEHLQKNPQVVPDDASLYILRSLNPDGEALASDPESRLNAHGVDLDRNFDANWKETWATGACPTPEGSAGEAPGSEPETQALADFIQERGIQALVVYDVLAEGIALGGKSQAQAVADLARSLAETISQPYPPPAPRCQRTGALIDWAAANGALAAITINIGSEEPDLQAHLKALGVLLSWEAPPPSTATVTPSPSTTGEAVTPTVETATESPAPAITISPGVTP